MFLKNYNLRNKTALVTGAGKGLGRACAIALAEAGANLVIISRTKKDLDEVSRKIRKLGIKCKSYVCDITNYNDIKEIINKQAKIDILVNNAGITHLKAPLDDVTEDEFDRVIAVNAKSVYLTAKHLIPLMKKEKKGSILNVASTAGISPRANLSWYNASKGWMITATKTMAVELAPFGIRTNAICPVAGETPLLKSFMGEDTPEIREKFLATIPIGRFSTPQDMANAALFLCSDEASMITGVALEVDGGRCI